MTEFRFKVGDRVKRANDAYEASVGKKERTGTVTVGGAGFRRQDDQREWVTVLWDGPSASSSDRLAEGLELIDAPASPVNWEEAKTSFRDVLKGWQPTWTRDRKAAELRVPRGTFDSWCDGRACEREASIRRLMTMIDRATLHD